MVNILKFIILFQVLIFNIYANAGTVDFFSAEDVNVNAGPLQNELCKMQIAITDYLSGELACAQVDVDYNYKGAGIFKKGFYEIFGTAKCPGKIAEVVLETAIAECEECNTMVVITSRNSSGQSKMKEFELSMPKYECQ